MTEQLKKISIRGRFAFCLACLRNAMKQEGVNTESLSPALERLEEFLYTKKLDEWEKKVVEIAPDTLFDNHPDNDFDDYETISTANLVRLKSVYEKLPSPIIKLLDLTISVGLSNLYGGTSEYSPQTLVPTLEIIALMNSNSYELPSLINFAHYSFANNNGWGFTQDREQALTQQQLRKELFLEDKQAHILGGELKEAAVGFVFPPAAVVGAVALELSEAALVAGVAVDVAVAIDHPTQDNWVTVGGDALAIATGYAVGKLSLGPPSGPSPASSPNEKRD